MPVDLIVVLFCLKNVKSFILCYHTCDYVFVRVNLAGLADGIDLPLPSPSPHPLPSCFFFHTHPHTPVITCYYGSYMCRIICATILSSTISANLAFKRSFLPLLLLIVLSISNIKIISLVKLCTEQPSADYQRLYAKVRFKIPCTLYLPHKVKMQYVHCRLIESYFLFPCRNPAEMSRRSNLFHN